MDRSSSWTNAGRNADYIPPSRVARLAVPSPRAPPSSTAEAVATSRCAEYGTGGSILPVLPTASPNASKRTSWTTPRSSSPDTLEDEVYHSSNETFAPPPRRAEMASMAATRRPEPTRQRSVSDGLFASDTEQAQLAYMEQMYGTINLLNAELESERRSRAALETAAAVRPSTYPAMSNYSSLEDDVHIPVNEFDEPLTSFTVSQTPVAPSYSPRKLRTMPSPPSHPPQSQHRVARPPVSPRSVVKDQNDELCATLGKNAELRIRSRDMERTVEKTELELELARKQIKMAKRRAENREDKLRALLKEKLNWQKELKATRAQVVEEKMRQVDLFREVEGAKRHNAAELEAVEQELRVAQEENNQLRAHSGEMKAQMNFQARKMEDMARQAQDEKARFVTMIEDTRHRFREWKEGEAETLAAAHDQAVRNLKTEYELKMERHQDEKQKLREKVIDLEVSIRLLQKDKTLSPLELSLRKTAILGSKDNTSTFEAEQIETRSRILELENLLAHSQEYQARQESIIKLSESTISRLMQERQVTALENLSLHPFGVEPQRSEDLSYDAQLRGYVTAPSSPVRQMSPPEISSLNMAKSTEPSNVRSPKSRAHTPRRADLEASIAQAAEADSTTNPSANTESTVPSSREQILMDELAQVRKALAEAQAKTQTQSASPKVENSNRIEQEHVEMPEVHDTAVNSSSSDEFASDVGVELLTTEADVETVEPLSTPEGINADTKTPNEATTHLEVEGGNEKLAEAEDEKHIDDCTNDETTFSSIDKVPCESLLTPETSSCQDVNKERHSGVDVTAEKTDAINTETKDSEEIWLIKKQNEVSAIAVRVDEESEQQDSNTHGEKSESKDTDSDEEEALHKVADDAKLSGDFDADFHDSSENNPDEKFVRSPVVEDEKCLEDFDLQYKSNDDPDEMETTREGDIKLPKNLVSHSQECKGKGGEIEGVVNAEEHDECTKDIVDPMDEFVEVPNDLHETFPDNVEEKENVGEEVLDRGATDDGPVVKDTVETTACENGDGAAPPASEPESSTTLDLGVEVTDAEIPIEVCDQVPAIDEAVEIPSAAEFSHTENSAAPEVEIKGENIDVSDKNLCAIDVEKASSEDLAPDANDLGIVLEDADLPQSAVDGHADLSRDAGCETPISIIFDSAGGMNVDDTRTGEATEPEVNEMSALDKTEAPDISSSAVENESIAAPTELAVDDKVVDIGDTEAITESSVNHLPDTVDESTILETTPYASVEGTKVENENIENSDLINNELDIERPEFVEPTHVPASEAVTDLPVSEIEETPEVLAVETELRGEEQEESVDSAKNTLTQEDEITAPPADTPEACAAKVLVAVVEFTALSLVASLQATSNTIALATESAWEFPSPDVYAEVENDGISATEAIDTLGGSEIAADMVPQSEEKLSPFVENAVVEDDTNLLTELVNTLVEPDTATSVVDTEVAVATDCDVARCSEVENASLFVVDALAAVNNDTYETSVAAEEQQPTSVDQLEQDTCQVPVEEEVVAHLTKAFAENFVKQLLEMVDSTPPCYGNQEIVTDENVATAPTEEGAVEVQAEYFAEEATVETRTPLSANGISDSATDTVENVSQVVETSSNDKEVESEAVNPSLQVAAEEDNTFPAQNDSLPISDGVEPSEQTPSTEDVVVVLLETIPANSTQNAVSDAISTVDTWMIAREFVETIESEAMSSVLLSLQTGSKVSSEDEFESDSTRNIIESCNLSSEEQNEPSAIGSELEATLEQTSDVPSSEFGEQTEMSPESVVEERGEQPSTTIELADTITMAEITQFVHDCVESAESEVLVTLAEIGTVCELLDGIEEPIILNEFSTQEIVSGVACLVATHAIAEVLNRLTQSYSPVDNQDENSECDGNDGVLDKIPAAEGSCEEDTGLPASDKSGAQTEIIESAVIDDDVSQELEVPPETSDIYRGVDSDVYEEVVAGPQPDESAGTSLPDISDLQSDNDDNIIQLALIEMTGQIIDCEATSDSVDEVARVVPESSTETHDNYVSDLTGNGSSVSNRSEPSPLGETQATDATNRENPTDKLDAAPNNADAIITDLVVEDIVTAIENCNCVEPDCGSEKVTTFEEADTTDDLSVLVVEPSIEPASRTSLPDPESNLAKVSGESAEMVTEATTLEGEASESLETTDAKAEDTDKHGDIEAYAARSIGFPLEEEECVVRLTLDSVVDAVVDKAKPSSTDMKVGVANASHSHSTPENVQRHSGRARSVHFSSGTKDANADRLKYARQSVRLWQSPLDAACAKEAVENSAKRRASRRRTCRRTLADLFAFPTEMARFTSSDTTLLAYDARHEQGNIFSLLDQSILTINPNGQHIHLDDSDERVQSKIICKRKTLMQELHSKNLALRQIPRFNYMPMQIKFQWSDFVVASPVRPSNINIGEGHVVKSPVEPMRLLRKRGAKLPCGSYVIVSAFIRPLEDGNENLRVQIYDAERVEEFQFDFSEDIMKKYHLETTGIEAQSLEFLGHLEFRRDEDTIIIKLPEKKAGEGGKSDVDRIQSERIMVGGEPRKRESTPKQSRMGGYHQKRPASSPATTIYQGDSELSVLREPSSVADAVDETSPVEPFNVAENMAADPES